MLRFRSGPPRTYLEKSQLSSVGFLFVESRIQRVIIHPKQHRPSLLHRKSLIARNRSVAESTTFVLKILVSVVRFRPGPPRTYLTRRQPSLVGVVICGIRSPCVRLISGSTFRSLHTGSMCRQQDLKNIEQSRIAHCATFVGQAGGCGQLMKSNVAFLIASGSQSSDWCSLPFVSPHSQIKNTRQPACCSAEI